MAQLSDDCFAFGGELMRTDEALALLTERLSVVVDREDCALRDAAGRILAEDITSTRAVPPHDNAAVDGYAVRFEDLSADGETRLVLTGRIAAGDISDRPIGAGEAIRIFTGAAMPADGDTVLMQEDCREDRQGDNTHVVIPPGIKQGANRRFAGEDIAAGDVILKAGTKLRPQEIGLTASIGLKTLSVYKPVRVALFSTGDEVRDAGEDLPPGCIYDANRYSVAAALERLGCIVDDLGILPDSYDVIRDTLSAAADDHDLIMTSGGVSTGEEDHVRAAIDALGKMHFWRLAIRPGRPLALGQIGNIPFIGLPGNPVAVLVTFMRFARPAILRLGGSRVTEPAMYRVRAGFPLKKKLGRREWLRVRLDRDADGAPVARKFPRDGAGILTSMVESDGLVELPEELTSFEAGTMVDFLPFSEIG
ncbi:MAG: molybdopterin molybdotransferase MoeA [Alphaproteobacteria bacterium]|nr:molybdopterin molybdotransferase MoeA [Alphaproteobacteria bacterium]